MSSTMYPIWTKLAKMPFHLGHHPALGAPAAGLIAEARVVPPNLLGGRPTGRFSRWPMSRLQHRIVGQTDREQETLGLKELGNLRSGEGCVGAEVPSQLPSPIPNHDRLQNRSPAIGTVDVAGPQGATLQIAELVEHEQRMVTGAAKMAVPGGAFLLRRSG